MNALIQRKLIIKPSSVHGMGVFAGELFQPGEVIEECHLLILSEPPYVFKNYLFLYADNQRALPLGAGSIYNHADSPNATYAFDVAHSLMRVKTIKRILPGEEIFIPYGKTWFNSRKMPVKKEAWHRRCARLMRHSSLARFCVVLTMSVLVLNLLKTF